MKNDDLEKLKDEISKLSKEELKERYLYLRKLAMGELQGPPVGYPSIDKAQLMYYDMNKYFEEKPKMTVTEKLFVNNANNLNYTAIEFFGNKISFRKLFNNIKDTVKSLSDLGIKEGDYVTICATGLPEVAYLFYAMGYIGSVGLFLPPYLNEEKMISDIGCKNSKVLIVMDKLYDFIKEIIDESSIEKIIIIPTLNSSLMPFLSKKLELKNPKKEILWNDFIKQGKKTELPPMIEYKKDMPLSVVYSSGTTGNLKGILLSHDSYQNSVQSYPEIGVDISKGQKLYQIIPAWSSTGTSTCLHLPLTYGCCVFMDPRFTKDKFAQNISKRKINYAVGTTSLYEGFEDKKNVKNRKFPDFHYPFVGGTPITEKQKTHLEAIFREHGCENKVRTAYGRCEDGAAITTQNQQIAHQKNSVGIPLSNVTVEAIDEHGNELSYNQRGTIMVSSKCGMLEYYNNPNLNKNFYTYDSVGNRWSKTGDIGYVGSNGEVFILGRSNDFSMINGKKIYNFDIKSILVEEKDIRDCEVVCKETENGNSICAHIIFESDYNNDEIDSRLLELQEIIYKEFNDVDMVPEIFKIRKQFPIARSTKRDMRAIKEETEGFIYKKFTYGKTKIINR